MQKKSTIELHVATVAKLNSAKRCHLLVLKKYHEVLQATCMDHGAGGKTMQETFTLITLRQLSSFLQKYLYMSRHQHACNRERCEGGKFARKPAISIKPACTFTDEEEEVVADATAVSGKVDGVAEAAL